MMKKLKLNFLESAIACVFLLFSATLLSSTLGVWGNPSEIVTGAVVQGGTATVGSNDLSTQYSGVAMTWVGTSNATIDTLCYHQGATTGTPASNSYSIALFPLTTGGIPNTGTTFGNAALNSVTVTSFTPTNADDNKEKCVSLGGNTYTVTQGQELAIVLWRAGATDAANKITATDVLTNSIFPGVPAYLSSSSSAVSWAKPSTSSFPVGLAMKAGASVYGRPYTGSALINQFLVGNTTESGVAFTIPTSYGSTVDACGVRLLFKSPATSATDVSQAVLYSNIGSSPPTQLAKTAQIINDRFQRLNGISYLDMWFTTTVTLTTGTQYGIGLSNTSGGAMGSYTLNQEAVGDFNAWDYQQSTSFMTRTASAFASIAAGTATGSFSTTTTQRPFISLIYCNNAASASMGGVY